jgi:hypothetical protein
MEENTEFKRIAFLANNEIFYIMHIPQIKEFDGVYEGLLSEPKILDISDQDFFINPGTVFLNGEFYVPISSLRHNDQDEPDYEVE